MDKRLLDALNNLSDALENIADALKNRKDDNKSATTQALQSGDLSTDFKKVLDGIKSIKSDTQEILRNQRTLVAQSKRKSDKSDMFGKAGDKKSENNIKKGVGVILLIALAVLAIGMAFKLVGKVDFASVIGLSIALVLIAHAVEKVAVVMKDLTLKGAFKLFALLVFISLGILATSYILGMIKPVSPIKLLTAGLIIAMFAVSAKYMEPIFDVARKMRFFGGLKVMIVMVAISLGITASSHILAGIRPISPIQGISAIFIAAMFAVISFSIERLAAAVVIFRRAGIGKVGIMLTMVAIAAGITASSHILSLINPISFKQAITAILIAAMFALIGLTLHKIAIGISVMKAFKVKKRDILFVLVGIATAITASSWILSQVTPMTLMTFLTAFGIALMFSLMSLFFLPLAVGITLMDRLIGSKKMLTVVPLIFIGLSMAIMLSSHILSGVADMDFMFILKILAFGISLGLVTLAMMPSVLAVGIAAASGVGAGAILLGAAMIPVIALAVMVSSHILSEGKYAKYPGIGWALGVGATMLGFTAAVIALGVLAITGVGAVAILAGTALVPMIAQTVVDTDAIIAKGKYAKYPGIGWIASVGFTMTAFGAAVVGLGALAVTGIGAVAMLAGAKFVPMIAETIVETDKIIAKGKYSKYPGLGWIASVGATMTGFGAAVVGLGVIAIQGMGLGALAIWSGTKMVPMIAETIVETDKIIAKGKYNKYPGLGWVASVGATMTGFGLAVVTLGTYVVGTLGLGGIAIGKGAVAVKTIANTIVTADKIIAKGKYDKYPGLEWALSVGGLMTAFGLAVVTLGTYVVGTLGLGGIAIGQGAVAVKTIAKSIVTAAKILHRGDGFYKGGPTKEWSEGVSLAIGAFAPVYKMMMRGGIMEIFAGKGPNMWLYTAAIETISKGIVAAASFFGSPEANVAFKGGPTKEWSEGVGKAIGAFAPVYKMMTKGGLGDFFNGTGPSIKNFVWGIKAISKGIIGAAGIFAENTAPFADGSYPKPEWGRGVGAALNAFASVFNYMQNAGWLTSGEEAVNQMVFGIKKIAYSIVKVGYIFGKSKVKWEGVPGAKWGESLIVAVNGYIESYSTIVDSDYSYSTDKTPLVARQMVWVAKLLAKNSKFFNNKISVDFMKAASESMIGYIGVVDEMSSLSPLGIELIEKNRTGTAAKNIVKMAEYFKVDFGKIGISREFMKSSMKAMRSYMGIVSELSELSPLALHLIKKNRTATIAKNIVSMAEKFKGKNFSGLGISDDFMRSLAGNVSYYLGMVKKISRAQKDGAMSNMLFGDPVVKLADGMVRLAVAYEKMATALVKFNAAVSNIDEKKLKSYKTINSMAMPKKGVGERIGDAVGETITGVGNLVGGALNRLSNVVTPAASRDDSKKIRPRGKYGDMNEQMDKLIELMMSLKMDTKQVDKYITERLNEILMSKNSD